MGLSADDTNRLLLWLKANAAETARDLRDAGWEEDARGLWSRGNHRGLHLIDAEDVGRETGDEC
jgi:hypothetical protein